MAILIKKYKTDDISESQLRKLADITGVAVRGYNNKTLIIEFLNTRQLKYFEDELRRFNE